MAISSLTYNKIQSWYNSERRLQTGNMTYYDGSVEHVLFTHMQTFHLNLSNTDAEHTKTVTLFTYANGVKIEYEYYHSSTSEDTIFWNGTIRYIDKDGNTIRENPGVNGGTSVNYATESSVPLYFNVANTEYPNMSFGEEATRLYYYDIYYIREELPAGRTPMHLNGDITTYGEGVKAGWSQYYRRNASWITTDEQYNNLLGDIDEGGDGTPVNPILPSEDTSDPGGGDTEHPDYNPFSDPVEFPGLPTGGSAMATGFIRVYTPTASQLQSLAGVLWSDSFVETIKKVQNDPMEAIISLHSLPMSLSSGTAECRIGNFNSGITMNTVSSQYVKRDLGSLYIPEHWASALDYGPYNTVDIFLPYVGVRSLQIDDVVGKTLKVEYNVDILSGATVVSVMCGNSVLYTYNTSLISYHPISQSSFGPLYQSIANGMGNVISGAVAGGIGGAVGGALGSAINVAMSKHSTVSRGGSIGGNSGCLGGFVPYLIIHRPIQSLASGFAHFKGYPSNITATLGSVSGYTEVESVHLDGITCTDNEKAEIEALLYNGVIL